MVMTLTYLIRKKAVLGNMIAHPHRVRNVSMKSSKQQHYIVKISVRGLIVS